MRGLPSAITLLAGLALLTASPGGAAQSAPAPDRSPAAYRPGLGDLMTMTVQPRHVKLALAGGDKNWVYANYELHELQEAFDRVAHVWPRWRSISIADMVDAVVKGPMTDLDQAIKARDGDRFAAAYGRLTDACNACHQGANRGFVVIRKPDASSFPDQDFAPVRR